MTKFGIAPLQTARDRQRASKNSGRPGKGEEREDRPSAVIPITLRLRREPRLCQAAITTYTRWPFLDSRSAPVRRTFPRKGIIRPVGIIGIGPGPFAPPRSRQGEVLRKAFHVLRSIGQEASAGFRQIPLAKPLLRLVQDP